MRDKADFDKICKNCQCRKGMHYPRSGGLVCPPHKNMNEPKFFEEQGGEGEDENKQTTKGRNFSIK